MAIVGPMEMITSARACLVIRDSIVSSLHASMILVSTMVNAVSMDLDQSIHARVLLDTQGTTVKKQPAVMLLA